MAEPLNPKLYHRLKEAFGSVKVGSEGRRMDPEPISVPDPIDLQGKTWHLEVNDFGEYYRVCCPFCNDTRHRLYVNHCYGQREKGTGRSLNFLAICYNEGCMADPENRLDFRERLECQEEELALFEVHRGKAVDPFTLKARPPGPVRNLTELPRDHKARRYVESRHFDPDRLGRYYGVGYVLDSLYYLAKHRIYVPVLWRGKLVGWQVRYLGELPWKDPEKKQDLPPKYWTMPNMPRGSILSNFDNARQFRTGVLVEGWFDVFGFGPMCMAVLGNTVSEQQISTFSAVWGKPGRSGVWLLDPDAYALKGTQRNIARLKKQMSGQLAVVQLPKGTDPGSLDRAFARDYVEQEARDQDVKVYWERV